MIYVLIFSFYFVINVLFTEHLLLYSCSYGSFKDALTVNTESVDERRNGNVLDGSGRILIKVSSLHLSGRTEENHEHSG
jgi:hypothetical protein